MNWPFVEKFHWASNLFSYPLFGGIVGGADIAIVFKSYFDEYLTKQLQSNEEYVDRVLLKSLEFWK